MLKDYIVISNKAETVSRISLEKLGFSTKRNDAKTIGQFGSGIKYAPIAALNRAPAKHASSCANRAGHCSIRLREVLL